MASRVADLVSKMTVAEKAGLMVHASLAGFTGPNGAVLDTPAPVAGPAGMTTPRNPAIEPMDRPTPRVLVVDRQVRWILVRPAANEPPQTTATFSNAIQELAEGTRLGIPVVFSTDPRHASPRRIGEGQPAPVRISRWPEHIGFGALRDPQIVRRFGEIARQEYRALGIHVGLSPMADVATEPRWNRIPGTFGEDPALVADLVRAYVESFQGPALGPESVMTVTKHYPGDEPVKGGLDPHNDYGQWQVYPGKQFDLHLRPFEAAFGAGTGGIMSGYAIPVGYDTVAMAYSTRIITDMLRGRHRFDGLVVTDWLRSMPWGVEHLTEKQRHQRIVEAGSDQIGGDNDPKYIRQLAEEGVISVDRLDASARRILAPMFKLGLFENPYVDADRAGSVVASDTFTRAGLDVQRRSMVLIKNDRAILPLGAGKRIYVENIDRQVAAHYGTVVDDVTAADVAIIEVTAPFALRPNGTGFARFYKEGTLAYAGATNAAQLAAIDRLAASGTPCVVVMYLDRPAILTEFIDKVPAMLAHFNASDEAMLDVVFGRAAPEGKLPFHLPATMAAVERQLEDVPFDVEEPLFKYGFGLSYEKGRK
ncbi:MAG: glycoside hydrolase family 3 C-terminal domain-containing protein [Acidobacteria bacterium]|nr:glycoside hydrolase family 3 C-terminal domain-containing protein [Acidobacteriota bacterium]